MRLQVGRQKPTHWENGKQDEKIQGPYWLTNFYLSPDFLRKQSLPWWLSHCWFDFVPCRWKHASLTATKAQNVNEVILTSLTFPARFELISYQMTGAWALKWKTKTNLKKKKGQAFYRKCYRSYRNRNTGYTTIGCGFCGGVKATCMWKSKSNHCHMWDKVRSYV